MTYRAIAFAIALLPASAHAASGEGGGSSLLWQALNLVLLLAVLYAVTRKPIQNYFRERRSGIQGNLNDASQLLQDARGRLEEWEGRVAQLDVELEAVRATARERAEGERDRILEEARASAERVREDAKAAVAQELRRAQSALRDEAAELAVELAGKLLADQVGDADRTRLVDEFVARIERGAGPSGTEN